MSWPLLCFSGGCDSTYLLYLLAKHSSSACPVQTFAINHPQIPCLNAQWRQRQRILKEMKKRGHHINHREMKIEIEGDGINGDGIPQVIIWLNATQYLTKEQDLWLGYKRGDCFFSYQERFQSAFKQIQSAADRTGSYKFPLQHTYKRDIIYQLEEAGLMKLIWTCERAGRSLKPCGECNKCIEIATAHWQLKRWGPARKEPLKVW